MTEKCVPTVELIKQKFKYAIGFKGENTIVRKLLKKLGFQWIKTKSSGLISQKEVTCLNLLCMN